MAKRSRGQNLIWAILPSLKNWCACSRSCRNCETGRSSISKFAPACRGGLWSKHRFIPPSVQPTPMTIQRRFEPDPEALERVEEILYQLLVESPDVALM